MTKPLMVDGADHPWGRATARIAGGLPMIEFLPEHVQENLKDARSRNRRTGSRLHVRQGGVVFPIVRSWDGGFALEAETAPAHMRGLVDVFDGSRHIQQGLIVASAGKGGELICEFKRVTRLIDSAPRDYWSGDSRISGYLA